VRRSDFGEDFTWGVASAAFQIEGAAAADGKRPSVWDEAARTGRIAGPGGADGIDFFHRVDEDLDLIAGLGVGANRFSISWPRVFGDGTGPWNEAGGAFYDRVIDGCLARGLEPWVTIHHWDLPLELHRRGGWANRDIVGWFADFAAACAERFGDRVRHWMVFNEPSSVAGHLFAGIHGGPPGRAVRTLRSVHHMNLAQAEAARRMRDVLGDGHDIGTTNVMTVATPYETADPSTERRKAAVEAIAVGMFMDPFAGLGYPTDRNRLLRLIEPAVQDGDVEACRCEWDFMGVQYYGPVPLRRLPVVGAVPGLSVAGAEVRLSSDIGIPTDPDGLLWVLRRYADHPAARRLVITESGFGCQDRLREGRVDDDIRVWYHREHLHAVLAARAEGIPVDGYFAWSYADNIEWVLGRRPRYGLVHIDYERDFARTPKRSYRWFRDFLTA
jgi:beta-glucosidase